MVVIIGVVLTIYVSLTTFFAANANTLGAVQRQLGTPKSAANADWIKRDTPTLDELKVTGMRHCGLPAMICCRKQPQSCERLYLREG